MPTLRHEAELVGAESYVFLSLPPRRPQHEGERGESTAEGWAGDVHLDPAYYARGTAARMNAFSAFAVVDVLLSDVEEHAEQLLTDLLDLIGESEHGSSANLNHC